MSMSKYIYPEDQLPTPGNLKLLAMVGQDKTVLEVGCALGYQTRAMQELQGCRVTGVEIDPDAAGCAAPYCEKLVVGDIESLDLQDAFGDARFDVITFADVLEHLREPAAVLRRIRPLLKAGGYVVASIPHIAHSSVIYELARGRFNYQALGLLDNTHIRFFTRESIFRTFEEGGFNLLAVDRTLVPPADTEFATRPVTNEDFAFLAYIKQRNADAETYKFIVKAIAFDDADARQTALVATTDRVHAMQVDNDLLRERLSAAQSRLEWLDSRPLARLRLALRRFF